MADTLLNMVIRVLRSTGQNANITTFSDANDTQYLVDKLNEAQQNLHSIRATSIDADGSLTITPSTRLFANPVSGLNLYDIYDWSWRTAENTKSLQPISLEALINIFPKFETYTADAPDYIYFDNNQIGIYPLLAPTSSYATLTLKFKYPLSAIRKTLATDVFPYPDKWLKYMEKYAQLAFELRKKLGVPQATESEMRDIWGEIFGSVKRQKHITVKAPRLYP